MFFVRCTITLKSKTVRSKIHTEVFDICCQTGFQKLCKLEKDSPQGAQTCAHPDNQEGGWDGEEGSRGGSLYLQLVVLMYGGNQRVEQLYPIKNKFKKEKTTSIMGEESVSCSGVVSDSL